MLKFRDTEIKEALGDLLISSNASSEAAFEPLTDTSKIKGGELFIGLRGGNTPKVAQIAVDAGAGALLLSFEADFKIPSYLVKDTEKALAALGAYRRAQLKTPIIAVTGSNGKTTTKNMLAAALSARGEILKTQGNLNNELGVPLTLLNLTSEANAAVVEMGMNHKGEISVLSRLTRPDAAVISNIGTAHLEFLGSRENIARAKAEIFEGLEKGAAVALPYESDFFALLKSLAEESNLKVISFGHGSDCEFVIQEESIKGLKGILKTPKGQAPLSVPVFGNYQAANIAAAAAGALALFPELTVEEISAGLAKTPCEHLRNEVHEKNGVVFILDCYNANPDSMEASLKTFKNLKSTGKKAVLLGSMLEIGEAAEAAHEKMGRLAAETAQKLLFLGDFAKAYAKGAKEAGGKPIILEKENVIENLRAELEKGDTILFKGSRLNKLESYYEEI